MTGRAWSRPARRQLRGTSQRRHDYSSTSAVLPALRLYSESSRSRVMASEFVVFSQASSHVKEPRAPLHLPFFESVAAMAHRPDLRLRHSPRDPTICPVNLP